MVIISFFRCFSRQPDICDLFFFNGHCSFVYDAARKAISVQRAFSWLSTITCLSIRINDVFSMYYFGIMGFDDLLHISCAPIADLYVVFVE